jgi:ribosomal protein S18 acetylase RimI-like enzyme
MSIHMKSYSDSDLPRLEVALAGWIQAVGDCGYYHPGNIAHRIYEGYTGSRAPQELVQLWLEGSELVGFAYNFVFDAGFLVFTCPRYRGSAVEQEMLQRACETTRRYVKATRRDDQTVITDVYDCDQTRIDLLTDLGFAPYRTWDWITERRLRAPIADPVLPEGFTIRGATPDDFAQLATIRNNTFDGDWTPAIYRTQVMQSAGYQPENELVIVAPDGRFAAFTVIRLDPLNKVGLFEPVGTHSNFRRLGLARALLLHGLREMQRHGMERASAAHAADNVAARDLYRALGFVKRYETLGFQQQ